MLCAGCGNALASPETLAESMTRPEDMSMNRDTYGGAVHGLGKRGMTVSMADHGCAGGEPEGLAQKLPRKFCDIARRRTLARGFAEPR